MLSMTIVLIAIFGPNATTPIIGALTLGKDFATR